MPILDYFDSQYTITPTKMTLLTISADTIKEMIVNNVKTITIDNFDHRNDIIYANYNGLEYTGYTNAKDNPEYFTLSFINKEFNATLEFGVDSNRNPDDSKVTFTYNILNTDNITDLVFTQYEYGSLMTSYDKIKLDGISLDDIEYINDGIQEIKEYRTKQFIYGIKIDPNNSNPNTCVTYTDDAVGFTPLKVNQTTGICNYGIWEPIINDVFGIKPFLVKTNGSVIFELDPNNYNQTVDGVPIDIESGTFGQVMIRFNHLYYKFSVDENKLWFQVSNKQIDNTWVDTAFAAEDGIGTIKDEIYIAAYESCLKNNMLQSISNASPSFKLDFEHIEISSEFGVFNMMNIVRKQFITFLGYLVTKSIDLEGNIGSGNTTSSLLNTGTMNTKGLFYGKNNKTEGVKMFGIENLWGNQLKYMHGIVQKLVYVLNKDTQLTNPEQHIYIKEFYPYNKIEDFDDMGKITENTSGYISSIKFLSDSVYIPGKFAGSSSTYFKSYFQNGKSDNANHRLYGIYGGSNKYGDKAGSEFLLLAYLNEEYNEATTHIIY